MQRQWKFRPRRKTRKLQGRRGAASSVGSEDTAPISSPASGLGREGKVKFSWSPYEAVNNVDFKQIARYFPSKMGLF